MAENIGLSGKETEQGIKRNGVIVVGLGPGGGGYLSLETIHLLGEHKVILRTKVHPAVAELERRGIAYETCDHYYEAGVTFEEVYNKITAYVLETARTQTVVYAVPGSPLVAEKTVLLLRQAARKQQIPLTIKPAMSFLDLAYTALEIDPIDGLRIIDAQDFGALAEAGQYPLMITQVYDPLVASDMKLSLMEALPDETPVYFLRNLGLPDEECVKIPLFEVDRRPHIDHLTSVFIPGPASFPERGNLPEDGKDDRFPLLPRKTAYDIRPLSDVMQVLREPGGCPWDREQNFSSIRANLIEECYEYIEAVDNRDTEGMQEELGDILMQVVFHARMAEEKGLFDLQSVIDGVTEKLIHRHPHVFGETKVKDSNEVLRNWETIKQAEKTDRKRILDGVYPGLPSLLRANKVQRKAAKVGFDWQEIAGVKAKVREEWQELAEAVAAQDTEAMESELGDVFFALVNYARHLGIESETALHQCNNRFTRRFEYVEDKVNEAGGDWHKFALAELDGFWDEAKKAEREGKL